MASFQSLLRSSVAASREAVLSTVDQVGPILLGVLRGGARALGARDLAARAQSLREGAIVSRDILRPARRLANAGRTDAADSLLQRGMAMWPSNPNVFVASALLAQARQHLVAAIERWETALQLAPERPECHVGLAGALRAEGEIPRGLEILDTARRLFPKAPSVLAESARMAETHADFEGALGYWERLCRTPRPHFEWVRRKALVLILLKRFDEVERLLEAATSRYGRNADAARGILVVRGTMANAREDWPAAVAHWQAFRAQYPDNEIGWQSLGRALHGLALGEIDTKGREPPVSTPVLRAPLPVEVVADEMAQALLLGFESIGNSCEFGLVQRRYGAEPLSLFRWNRVELDSLIAALGERLDGMGEPGNTELVVAFNGELMVKDRRWAFPMHTWLFAGQTDRDVLYRKMCRRIVFLRDKFLADLAAGDKIFVYASSGVDEDTLTALHHALRDLGPVRLLAVQPVHASAPLAGDAGDVRRVAEDLYVGFIRRLGRDETGAWNIAFDDWVSVCAKATTAMAQSTFTARVLSSAL